MYVLMYVYCVGLPRPVVRSNTAMVLARSTHPHSIIKEVTTTTTTLDFKFLSSCASIESVVSVTDKTTKKVAKLCVMGVAQKNKPA